MKFVMHSIALQVANNLKTVLLFLDNLNNIIVKKKKTHINIISIRYGNKEKPKLKLGVQLRAGGYKLKNSNTGYILFPVVLKIVKAILSKIELVNKENRVSNK